MSIEGRGVAWKGKEVQPGGIRQKETGRHCLRQNSQTGRPEVSPGRKMAGLQAEPKRRQEKAVEAARKKLWEREAEAARKKRRERKPEAAREKHQEREAARKKRREKEAGS